MAKVMNKLKSFLFPKPDRGERDLSSYIDLEMPCSVDPYAVITRSSKRLTVIRINGFTELLNHEKFMQTNSELLSLLKQLYLKNNVEIAWSVESDPENVARDLNKAVEPGRNTAKRLGINDSLYFDDVLASNTEVCTSEESWIAIWTAPKIEFSNQNGLILPVRTENTDLSKIHQALFGGSANPFKSEAQSIVEHQTNVDKLVSSFFDNGCSVERLPAKIALQFMNEKFNSSLPVVSSLMFVDDQRIAGPGVAHGLIDTMKLTSDYSRLFVQSAAEQIAKKTIVEDDIDDGILFDGKRYYATHTLSVAPKHQVPFSRLKKMLKGVPFRFTFMLKPKNSDVWERLNHSLNTFGRAAESNREAYRQLKFLRYMKEEHAHPTIQLQILIVTWAQDKETLSRYSELIANGLITWGDAGASYDNISPWETYACSIAGVNAYSHAESWLCDPDRLVAILPHQKSASMLRSSPIILRDSESGEPLYYGSQLKEQDYDVTLYLAKPRQGKSLLMNDKGLSNLVKETAEGINLLGSLDIGPNAAGAFQLARLMLAETHGMNQAKRMVVYHKWDPMIKGWYVNPLDIAFGQTRPTPIEKTGMLCFYSSVCCEPESGTVADGVNDLLDNLINLCFSKANSDLDAKEFDPFNATDFNEAIEKHRLNINKRKIEGREHIQKISYFELRDLLFQCGEVELAQKAHLLAVPTVNDLISALSSESRLIEKFEKSHPKIVSRVQYALSRHATNCQHLTRPTTLDFQDAHMVSFDLLPLAKERNSPAGKVKLFSEYLLAMSIVMKKFTINDSLLQFEGLPPIYNDYWRERVNKYANLDKCLNLDEWHMLTVKKTLPDGRVVSQPIAGAEYVDALIKEAPKWRMSINIATHSANDLTMVMRQKATNIFFYSGFTGEEAAELKTLFSLSDQEVKVLSELHGPQPGVGTEMLYIHYVNNETIKDSGRCVKRVEFLCSGSLLWALNTSAQDLPHKIRLEREFGSAPWMRGLIKAFPNGSMGKERSEIIELIKQNRGEDIDQSSIEDKLYERAVMATKSLTYSRTALDIANQMK